MGDYIYRVRESLDPFGDQSEFDYLIDVLMHIGADTNELFLNPECTKALTEESLGDALSRLERIEVYDDESVQTEQEWAYQIDKVAT